MIPVKIFNYKTQSKKILRKGEKEPMKEKRNAKRSTKSNTAFRLWNRNFFLLWQGQMVSVLGDALYDIALNFFVLEMTGSTVIMGTVMALVTVPRILLGPAAGVFVDRYDRKKLIVFGDVVRGVSVLFIAFAAWNGFLEIWMVMLAAVISGICASVFNPAIESVLPDIVPSDNMIRANSAYQAATTGADVLGESLGGILYTVIGAPFMFLIDGISYLFSACTEVFLEIPKIERKGVKVTFREDFREGLRFIWKYQGVVRIIGMSFLINYLFGVIRVLIIPWFAGEEKLGMARYGILNGVQSVGLVAGMAVLTVITIRTEQKYRVYLVTLLLFAASIGAGVFLNQYAAILISFFLAFGFQFVFNTVMNATLMAQTPVGYRGKVSATKTTLGMAISPLGNFAGGASNGERILFTGTGEKSALGCGGERLKNMGCVKNTHPINMSSVFTL